MRRIHASRSQKLIDELKAVLNQGLLTKAEIARELGVHRQRVSGWLRENNKNVPTLEHGLRIQELIKKIKRRRPKKPV